MRFGETEIPGVHEISLEPHVDSRGFFARLSCPEERTGAGIAFQTMQLNLSRNTTIHTLRGMHYQEPPFAEAKIVRVVRGAIFDVVVDLRADSATRHRWIGRVLDAKRGDALFVPEGCAHGFLTLEEDTDVLYEMGRMHASGQARGFRYDDPLIGIDWPHPPAVIAPADEAWAPLDWHH